MLMGGFVTAYNYLGYRLTTRPFGLASSMVGLLCLTGSGTSIVAGRLADKSTRPQHDWMLSRNRRHMRVSKVSHGFDIDSVQP